MKNLIILLLLVVLNLLPKRAEALNYNAEAETENIAFGRPLNNCPILYWCPTNNGSEWTRIEIHGMTVVSIKRYQSLFLEESNHQPSINRRNQKEEFSSNTRLLTLPYGSSPDEVYGSIGQTQNGIRSTDQNNHPPMVTQNAAKSQGAQNSGKPHIFSSSDGACFHTIEKCPSGRAIHNSNSISYASEKDAKEAGLIKCRRCLFIEKVKVDEL